MVMMGAFGEPGDRVRTRGSAVAGASRGFVHQQSRRWA